MAQVRISMPTCRRDHKKHRNLVMNSLAIILNSAPLYWILRYSPAIILNSHVKSHYEFTTFFVIRAARPESLSDVTDSVILSALAFWMKFFHFPYRRVSYEGGKQLKLDPALLQKFRKPQPARCTTERGMTFMLTIYYCHYDTTLALCWSNACAE